MKNRKKSVVFILLIIIILLTACFLLGSDTLVFLKWYVCTILFGAAFFPAAFVLFPAFEDRGWIFSKILGICIGGYLSWALICTGLVPFTGLAVCIVTLLPAVAFWIIDRRRKIIRKLPEMSLILSEEAVFLFMFLLWTYLAGFHPAASGTEKFMDYGFMASMMRSTKLPFTDMWYALKDVNYYYGGQYYGVYLTKITGTQLRQTYNLFRAMIAAFAFAAPFSLVRHMLREKFSEKKRVHLLSASGGILAGAAVSLAGNMHYVLYGLLGKVFKLSGYQSYWFPSSTRYIGYNPDTSDKVIHEFPCYSYILGDDHAHVINIMFVLLFIALLYSWMQKKENEKPDSADFPAAVLKSLLQPHILMAGILCGIFRWTNYWDYIIYLTVVLIGIVIQTIRDPAGYADKKRILPVLILPSAEVILLNVVAALPFTVSFRAMYMGVALCKNHSAFYQLAVLWGLPVLVLVLLFAVTVVESHREFSRQREESRFLRYIRKTPLPDLYGVLLGICAAGLVLIPEIVYVRDLYENGYARANTMFKLTYQAYIMFGLMMGYAFVRLLAASHRFAVRMITAVFLAAFLLTCGYFGYAVKCWYGTDLTPGNDKGLDAEAFLETDYAKDAAAIRWLEKNISGTPIVLEAPGSSYSEDERVSAMTGLPTVVGWYQHEWLWRNDPEDLNQKWADIQTIYECTYPDNVRKLIEKYHISYIFVGSCETKAYDSLNEEALRGLGKVVFSDKDSGTFIVKVSNAS